MKSEINIDINELLGKPLWQMTGQEFCALTHYAQEGLMKANKYSQGSIKITGVRDLAEYIGCCESTVFMLRRNGVLDDAIISQVGKRIVFDGEKARLAADQYQRNKRAINDE